MEISTVKMHESGLQANERDVYFLYMFVCLTQPANREMHMTIQSILALMYESDISELSH